MILDSFHKIRLLLSSNAIPVTIPSRSFAKGDLYSDSTITDRTAGNQAQ